MNDELIKHQLEDHDSQIKENTREIMLIKQENASLKSDIKNLCDNLKSLTNVMKWFICTLIGAFMSFFFYAVQNNIFK